MNYDLKQKIDYHGRAYMRDAAFSISRLIIVYFVIAVVFRGSIDMVVILLMVVYGLITVMSVRKKMLREKKYYTFEKGNPTYDYLSELGDPEHIINEINKQLNSSGILYNKLAAKPNKSSPETAITDSWFIHLNKTATVIPLDKIICAYIYDNVTKETPPDNFLPTHFKPLYFIVTYGEKKEAYIKHNAIDYKKALEVLDNKLNCKVIYTRELGTLYNTDYNAFLEKVSSLKGLNKQ